MQTTTPHPITTPKAPATEEIEGELRSLRDELFRLGHERAALAVASTMLELKRRRLHYRAAA